MRLTELRKRLAEIDTEIDELGDAIDRVPDSLPWSEFCRQLNNLESRGIALEAERERLQEQISLYEDLIAEVRCGLAS